MQQMMPSPLQKCAKGRTSRAYLANTRIVFDGPFDQSRENTEKRSLSRNQRSHLFSRDDALDVAMDIQIENYDRQAILLAK